jgi:hypothetical protein
MVRRRRRPPNAGTASTGLIKRAGLARHRLPTIKAVSGKGGKAESLAILGIQQAHSTVMPF